MKKQLLLYLLLLLPMAASADDSGTCGDKLTWTYVEATQTLTISGSGEMDDYTFDHFYLPAPWYSYREQIQIAIIDSGVTTIGSSAFKGCFSLTSITIGNSVTSIGDYAFYNCIGLTTITIPNSVTIIGDNAFYGCSSLTSITIPNSVTNIGVHAFSGTAWYDNQSDGLVYAGKVAYQYKGEMPMNTNITLQEGTVGITGRAFYGCSSLTSITIPNSVTTIGERAFYGCI